VAPLVVGGRNDPPRRNTHRHRLGAGSVWAVAHEGTLPKIDPNADSVQRTFRFGRSQSQGAGAEVAVGFGAVWIAAPGFQLVRAGDANDPHREFAEQRRSGRRPRLGERRLSSASWRMAMAL
jgi:hypothetical protein